MDQNHAAAPTEGPQPAPDGMKTLLIEWTEESEHRVKVQVPSDLDPDDIDLENQLAELANDGFIGLQRTLGSVITTEHDAMAEVLIHPDLTVRRARHRA